MTFRLILCAFIVLLPGLARAQLLGGSPFASGSYVLNASPNLRQQGQLKLQSGSKLLVKMADGQTLKLHPEQIHSFRITNRKYVTARNFHVKGGIGGAYIDNAFVEQLDSGQVVLLNYEYTINNGAGMSYGGSSTELNAYLLSRPGSSQFTAAQGSFYTGGGKQFREAVRPYLASRPDLVKLLDEQRISSENLREVIYALNNNIPYNGSAGL